MCQVESKEGVKEIAAVDGVKCVQMGPLDLSASMRRRGKGKGKDGGGGPYLGGFAMPFELPDDMRPRVYHMISRAVDIAMLKNTCVEDVKRFKSKARSNDDLDSIEIDKDSEKFWVVYAFVISASRFIGLDSGGAEYDVGSEGLTSDNWVDMGLDSTPPANGLSTSRGGECGCTSTSG
uniref:Aldehyde-lyase domain-containing protein n=1 Tax=Tanacetum cinerariifolium TaxID=118510 RepID=A0A6L2LK58_TANCI|nr:aldehyde-lyase domain-containing protein [Tanacetum cinerariifolium]